MSLRTAALFDRPEYSDLTIKFSGGEIRCHRLVLCTNSEYFEKLCGPSSHFAEKDQSIIELKGDDPRALKATLQYIYTKQAKNAETDTDWRLQLEIWKTANKYLVPDLVDDAYRKYQTHALALKEPSKVFEAFMHIREAAEGASELLEVADRLEKRDALALLQEPAYRDHLEDEDRETMWKHLDELRGFKSSLVQVKLAWCKKGCPGSRKVVELDDSGMRCNSDGCSRAVLNTDIVWVPASRRDQVLSNFNTPPQPVPRPVTSPDSLSPPTPPRASRTVRHAMIMPPQRSSRNG